MLYPYCSTGTYSTFYDHLPEIHRLLAKSSSKSHDCAIISMQFVERAQASRVPLNSGCAPMATTKLVDEVFHSFRPGGTGLTFGVGLSPFSIVCEGHAEMNQITKMIKQAELTEAQRVTFTHELEDKLDAAGQQKRRDVVLLGGLALATVALARRRINP